MKIFTCSKGCCKIKTSKFIEKKYSGQFLNKRKEKAGVFIHDTAKNKVLLVQSRGNLWGLPKGTIEYGETQKNCAVREVKEETGITITKQSFLKETKIYNNSVYFYVKMDECEVHIQKHIIGNDANGIGWIKPSCLENLIISGN